MNRTKAERSHPGVCPSRPHLVLPPSVGREKVNYPAGAREAGLGHDSARRFRDFARGISPPAGGELLCPWRQSNQNAPGDASDGLRLRFAPPRPIGRFPRTPFTGDTPEKSSKISGAQNLSDTLNSRRATGPWAYKNCRRCDSISAPEFAEPTEPVRILAGGPRASPTQTRKFFLKPVGEGLKVNRTKAERSHPGVCPRRPGPLVKGRLPLSGGRLPLSGGNVPKGQKG